MSALLITSITACKEGNSIYDPDDISDQPNPVIEKITPEAGYLAGVDSITVKGKNFSENPNKNAIYFDGEPGLILSSGTAQMNVRPAQVLGDSVDVRVSVKGAMEFSNTYHYKLKSPIVNIPGYNETHSTTGITKNSNGDIIYSLLDGSKAPVGIKVWKTDNTVEDYLSSSFDFQSLKVGPDGLLYGARNIYGIYRENNGSMDFPFAIGNSNEAYRSIDFGTGDYLWVVGDNDNIVRVDITNGSIARFPFTARLTAVRYYDGHLYVAGGVPDAEEELKEEVWSFEITGNNELTNGTKVFGIDDASEESMRILDLTFDVDGKMYLGTNEGSGIYTWDEETGLNEFYPGLIFANGLSLTWLDNYLIASIRNRGETTLHPTKINVMQQGAPYFGTD